MLLYADPMCCARLGRIEDSCQCCKSYSYLSVKTCMPRNISSKLQNNFEMFRRSEIGHLFCEPTFAVDRVISHFLAMPLVMCPNQYVVKRLGLVGWIPHQKKQKTVRRSLCFIVEPLFRFVHPHLFNMLKSLLLVKYLNYFPIKPLHHHFPYETSLFWFAPSFSPVVSLCECASFVAKIPPFFEVTTPPTSPPMRRWVTPRMCAAVAPWRALTVVPGWFMPCHLGSLEEHGIFWGVTGV